MKDLNRFMNYPSPILSLAPAESVALSVWEYVRGISPDIATAVVMILLARKALKLAAQISAKSLPFE
jgi:hypothetical protein